MVLAIILGCIGAAITYVLVEWWEKRKAKPVLLSDTACCVCHRTIEEGKVWEVAKVGTNEDMDGPYRMGGWAIFATYCPEHAPEDAIRVA